MDEEKVKNKTYFKKRKKEGKFVLSDINAYDRYILEFEQCDIFVHMHKLDAQISNFIFDTQIYQ